MLGFPRSDRDVLKRLSEVIAQFVDPLTGFAPAEMDAAIDEFVARTDALIDARRREPEADMVSALVAVEAEGDRLNRQKEAIPAFIGAFPDYRVDHDSLRWNRSVTLRGPSRLVVTSAEKELSQGGAGSVG